MGHLEIKETQGGASDEVSVKLSLWKENDGNNSSHVISSNYVSGPALGIVSFNSHSLHELPLSF